MIELLQNKNSATRFQILMEIAAAGPDIHQKSIASRLGISPQAVSEYIKRMVQDELVTTINRYSYKVTIKGVNWMLGRLRELNEFIAQSTAAVRNITTCAAIAQTDLKEGQAVSLIMKDGLLYATCEPLPGARGTATFSARAGEDIGVTSIDGLVDLARGKITILEVPGIQDGGSRQVDIVRLRKLLNGQQQVGTIGIEAMVALKRAGIVQPCIFGVADAAIEQAKCGLAFTILCTSDAMAELIQKIRDNNLEYEIISLSL